VTEDLFLLLPDSIRHRLKRLSSSEIQRIEEIRLRIGLPVEVVLDQGSFFLDREQRFTKEEGNIFLNRLSMHSLYTLEEEIRRGYITIKGGHRVGIAGKVVLDRGNVKHIRDITSFNIRIAREIHGAANEVLPLLVERGQVKSTLIISPPQCGKTTLIRDIARQLSYGTKGIPGKKVSIVDERSEIAGCVNGIPQKDVGPRTDVMDGCPKAEGMMMMIRSMSPDVLITDEIGRPEDSYALEEAIHAGIAVITTVHGKDLKDILRRPLCSKLTQTGVFERYLVLGRQPRVGTITALYDEKLNECRFRVAK